MFRNSKKIFLVGLLFLLAFPLFSYADSYGQHHVFYVEQQYDKLNREKIDATLISLSSKLYFYIDDDYWNSLSDSDKTQLREALFSLGKEFDQNIYPRLTSFYGYEWKPGIDNDYRITVLFEQMRKKAGGYIREADEYYKIISPTSNQREIIYLNIDYLVDPIEKSYLAHEFTHLITFYQKTKLRNASEEVWLNEARADYSPTFLGYDDIFEGSNLQRRVRQFLNSPSDSLTEWQNKASDYGV